MDNKEFKKNLKFEVSDIIDDLNYSVDDIDLENKIDKEAEFKKYIAVREFLSINSEQKMKLEEQLMKDIIEYFKNHELNFNNIGYWDNKRFDKNGNLYLNGDVVEEDLYSKICDIFILNQGIEKILKLELEQLGYNSNFKIRNNENDFILDFFNGIESKGNLGRIY